MIRILTYALALVACLAAPLWAADEEEDSGGMLVRFLQDTLSSDSRTVKVSGLEGAFSSRATIAEVTVSDDTGVWFTLRGAVLDWNRLALARGRFSVNTLAADEIIIARRPGTTTTETELPTPEATPFQVPELPVSIELGELRVDRFVLEEPVLGQAAELGIDGFLTLDAGTLSTDLSVTRLDRPSDSARLAAGFENATSRLAVDLSVVEEAGGVISAALRMPDRPSLRLRAAGEGPIADFGAVIGLASGGTDRVRGEVRLTAIPAATEDAPAQGIAFSADLNGDVTPFLPPDYREFFGTGSELALKGRRGSDGALAISDLSVSADAMRLDGALAIAADGAVQLVDLRGGIAPPDGEEVVLPMSGPRTAITGASFTVQMDRATGADWRVDLWAENVVRPDLSVRRAQISGVGQVGAGGDRSLAGRVEAGLNGIAFTDPALNRAVGSDLALDGRFTLNPDNTLHLQSVEAHGQDYRAALDGVVRGIDTGFAVEGNARIGAADLARFSGLAGRDLGGAVTARVEGTASPLSGSFDFRLDAQARDLKAGIDQLDPLIGGQTVLSLDAARGEDGLTIRRFDVNGRDITASASGRASGRDGSLKLRARVADLGPALPQLAGPVQLAADLTRTGDLWDGTARLDGTGYRAAVDGTLSQAGGRYEVAGTAEAEADDLSRFSELAGRPLGGAISARVEGTGEVLSRQFDLRLNARARDLASGIDRLDPLISGQTLLSVDAARDNGGLTIRSLDLNGQHLTASAHGALNPGQSALDFDARLADLGLLTPKLSGPLTLTGDVQQTKGIWGGEVRLKGPHASRVELIGTVAPDGTALVDFDAELTRLERLMPELAGTATAKGVAGRNAAGTWTVDVRGTAPAGIEAEVTGTWDEASGQADLRAGGQAQLNAANLFVAPNSAAGLATFDLTMRGEPSVAAISGTVATSGASFAIPSVAQTVNDIDATITIADSQASVAVTGGLRGAAGSFRVGGPVSLNPPFDTRLTIDLADLGLTDNVIFTTSLSGQMALAGPLADNPTLSGDIVFGQTDINLNAATGAAGAAPIPQMAHVGEPSDVRATRARAGLIETKAPDRRKAMGLDLHVIARNRVYVHGFGLDAEMAGDVFVRGTTARVEPSGQIELIRGTLDILSRKLKLTYGVITLQGDLRPYVEFRSTSSTSDGQATIEISGPISAPAVEVYAEPERPTEEALAMLLFGNRLSEMSPIVLAQMAASLARMGGAGGGGTKALKNATGIDSVGVESDSNGNAKVRAGAYVAENIYTEFTVNSEGETELNLNLEINDSLTVRGIVDSTGDTALGLYFGRDY